MADPAPLPSWFPSMRELEEALDAHRARSFVMPLPTTVVVTAQPRTVDPNSVIVSVEECDG